MTLHSFSLRSLFLLGLCAWLSLHIGKSATQAGGAARTKTAPPIAHFTDMATKAGLTAPVVFGGENTKKYIIETTGTGVRSEEHTSELQSLTNLVCRLLLEKKKKKKNNHK